MNISNYSNNIADIYNNNRKPIGINIIIEAINEYTNKTKKDIKILDCGCGTGNYTDYLIKEGYYVISIDQNKSMLECLKNKDLKNNEIYEVDIKKKLPFDNNYFDVIIINQVLHHLNDNTNEFIYHKNLFKEFDRVIKPNGLFSLNTCSLENYIYGYWWTCYMLNETMEYCKKYCPHNIICNILENNNFTYTHKICKEPFIGEQYYNKNLIFDNNIRSMDTLWKYVNDAKYEEICNNIKNLGDSFDIFFKERLDLLDIYGQSVFYICISNKI